MCLDYTKSTGWWELSHPQLLLTDHIPISLVHTVKGTYPKKGKRKVILWRTEVGSCSIVHFASFIIFACNRVHTAETSLSHLGKNAFQVQNLFYFLGPFIVILTRFSMFCEEGKLHRHQHRLLIFHFKYTEKQLLIIWKSKTENLQYFCSLNA